MYGWCDCGEMLWVGWADVRCLGLVMLFGEGVLWLLSVFRHVDNQIHMFAVFVFLSCGGFCLERGLLGGHVFPAPADLC